MAARKKKATSAARPATRKKVTKRKVTKKVTKKKVTKKQGTPARKQSDDPGLVRLNKYLADHGVDSRRKCDELIAGGKVTVDGSVVVELGTKIDPHLQKVEVDGVSLKIERIHKKYYLLNKPSGVVCTNERRETRPRAIDMITDPKKGRIYTVGRLDEDSTGLILLTNDGEYANRVMHPRYGVKKTYLVKLRGKIDDEDLNKVRNGIHLSDGRTAGARILVQKRTKEYTKLAVTLIEGMNREIRRSFARVGYKVVDLARIRIGPLVNSGMKRTGRWRELTLKEAWAVLETEDEKVEGEEGEAEVEAEAAPPLAPKKNVKGARARRAGIVATEKAKVSKKRRGGRKTGARKKGRR